jgi:hypothetical protein
MPSNENPVSSLGLDLRALAGMSRSRFGLTICTLIVVTFLLCLASLITSLVEHPRFNRLLEKIANNNHSA